MSYHGIVKQGKKKGNRKTHDTLYPLVISKGSVMMENCSFVWSKVLCFNFRNNISTRTTIPGIVHKFADLILGSSNVVLTCNLMEMCACVSPDQLRTIWMMIYAGASLFKKLVHSILNILGFVNYFSIYKDLVWIVLTDRSMIATLHNMIFINLG